MLPFRPSCLISYNTPILALTATEGEYQLAHGNLEQSLLELGAERRSAVADLRCHHRSSDAHCVPWHTFSMRVALSASSCPIDVMPAPWNSLTQAHSSSF